MPSNVLLMAAVLGLIQGLAEFLPISSSAHLILARHYFGWSLGGEDMDLAFDTVLHLGTMVAILAYFWKDVVRLNKALFGLARDAGTQAGDTGDAGSGAQASDTGDARRDRRLAIYILLATIPAGLAGALGEKRIEDVFRTNVLLIAIFLATVGVLMWLVDLAGKKKRDEGSVTFWDAMLIGLAQATALMPGVSRSGATITAGMALGFKREAAARFSFLLSTPAMAGAALWSARHLVHHRLPHGALPAMAIGFLVSAVVGYICIAGLLRYVRTRTLGVFTVYRLALAGYVVFMLVRGAPTP